MSGHVKAGYRSTGRGVYVNDSTRELLLIPHECRGGAGIDFMGEGRLRDLVARLHRITFRDPLAVTIEVEEVWGLTEEEVSNAPR